MIELKIMFTMEEVKVLSGNEGVLLGVGNLLYHDLGMEGSYIVHNIQKFVEIYILQ